MKRKAALALIAVGLAAAALGRLLLPADRGRLQYAVEVTDPRPWSESALPEGLADLRVTRLFAFFPRKRQHVVVAKAIRLKPTNPEDGPADIAMVEGLADHLSSADCDLGSLPQHGPRWLAGNSTGLKRGPAAVGRHTVRIDGVLAPLGPLLDESLWTDLSQPLAAELADAGWDVRAGYLVFALSWREQEQVLAQLQAEPGRLPAPGARILNPAQPPPLSDLWRLLLAGALVCGGIFLLYLERRSRRAQQPPDSEPRLADSIARDEG